LNDALSASIRKFSQGVQKNQLAPIRADASSEFSDNMREIFLLAFLIPLKCRRAQCFKREFKSLHRITRIAEFRKIGLVEENWK